MEESQVVRERQAVWQCVTLTLIKHRRNSHLGDCVQPGGRREEGGGGRREEMGGMREEGRKGGRER